MNDASLGILLTLRDDATGQLKNFSGQLRQTAAEAQQTGPKVTRPLNDIGGGLEKNRMAVRELGMGVMFLGTTFVTLGASMRMSNDEGIKNVGTMIMYTGAVMSAIGGAVQFISAITKIIHALKALQVQQIITQALAGPAGWATLAAGAAIAGGAVYGVSRMQATETKVSGAQAKAGGTTVNQYISGSVVTERQLTDNIHRALLIKEQRSGNTTGIK